ncbi:MAG: NAD(P)-dependent oxidoreductase [Bdellovibrionales bacterium]|nr:NAD(P)-dependent oxidoreductase [Bdellovibrionales bacterium]
MQNTNQDQFSLSAPTIVITGGAGLVGQNLVIELAEKCPCNIVVLDKSASNCAVLRKLQPNIAVYCCDLSNPGPWDEYFKDASAVVLLHAQIGSNDKNQFIKNNIDATRFILDAIDKYKIKRVVHISSSVVESVADDLYTQTKKMQEEFVLQSPISSVVLRPTLMFGWFDRKHLGWLSRFMKKVPVFPIPGDGKYLRQPLYVRDFCKMIVHCIANADLTGVYNISGFEKIFYIDLIHEIKRASGAKVWIVKIPYSLFHFLLRLWSVFDKNPPFTASQLEALVAGDEFEVIDWPSLFHVQPTPLNQALKETFQHPIYSKVKLTF